MPTERVAWRMGKWRLGMMALSLAAIVSWGGCGGGGSLLTTSTDGAGDAALQVTPSTLAFGTSATGQVLELKNESGRMLAYQILSDSAWLSAAPSSGELGDSTQQIQVAVARASLGPGGHSASLSVMVEGVETQQVPVTVTIATVAGAQSGGTGSGSPNTSATGGSSQLEVTPTELDFGSTGLTDTVFVRYTGGSDVAYTVTADVPWVTLENATGLAQADYQDITVHADRSGLASGSYAGTLTVSAGSFTTVVEMHLSVGTNSSQTSPLLYVTPARLDLGEDGESTSFVVRNTGSGTLDFSVESDVAWAVVSPTSGTVVDDDQTIQVTVSRDGLDEGDYSGTITIHSADGQTRTLVIQMTTAPVLPQLAVDVQRLDFGPNDLQLGFMVRNAGPGSLSYTITPGADWIAVSPASGSCTGTGTATWVTVSRCVTDLPAGTILAQLTLHAAAGADRIVPVSVVVPAPPTDAELLATLQALPPLPKVHVSTGTSFSVLDNEDISILQELIRITHSVEIHARWLVPEYVSRAVAACKNVNATHPDIPATIYLNYSPYHNVWPNGAPPTYDGPEYQQELDLFSQCLQTTKSVIAAADAAQGANVTIAGLMLDTEQWLVNENNDAAAAAWNQALTAKYNAIYDIAASILPGVPVHWSARGHPPGWRRFTLQEQGDSCSVECYYTWDINHVRISYRSIYNEAQLHGGGLVIPWIALGSGYYPTPDGSQWNYFCDLDYGVVYSWQLGAELNLPYYAQHPDQYAHWDAAQVIALYPGPIDPRNPRFVKHFAAYVKGANNMMY